MSRTIPSANMFTLRICTGETTLVPGCFTDGDAAGVALRNDGRPPFIRPIGKKISPNRRKMLEVPCAAVGSGVGIMQLHGAPDGGTVPLKRIIPAIPINMKTNDNARNSESNIRSFSDGSHFLRISSSEADSIQAEAHLGLKVISGRRETFTRLG